MDSERFTVDINLTNEGLNPMLPHVVGAIEALEEATFNEIKKHTETDRNKKISDTDLQKALNNGMKLGIVKMRREFKVCKEFTTREIKRVKYVEENLWTGKKPQPMGMNDEKKKSLWDFVKYHRDQRKKKMTLKSRKQRANKSDLKSDLSDYMCTKCRKSIERKESERSRSRHNHQKKEVWDGEDSRSSDFSDTESDASVTRTNLKKNIDNKVTIKKETQYKNSKEKSQGKSRLLVEKKPLETEPPYYDIYT